jgi:hypothetical protein
MWELFGGRRGIEAERGVEDGRVGGRKSMSREIANGVRTHA